MNLVSELAPLKSGAEEKLRRLTLKRKHSDYPHQAGAPRTGGDNNGGNPNKPGEGFFASFTAVVGRGAGAASSSGAQQPRGEDCV